MKILLPNNELEEFDADKLYEALIVHLLSVTDYRALDENAIPTRSLADCALSVAERLDNDLSDDEDIWKASDIWEIADNMIYSEVTAYLNLEPTESFSEWMIGDYEFDEVLA